MSYTSGNTEVAIRYPNDTGQTLHLTDFRVRVLDPNTLRPAGNIGEDNTVVLEVEKEKRGV